MESLGRRQSGDCDRWGQEMVIEAEGEADEEAVGLVNGVEEVGG